MGRDLKSVMFGFAGAVASAVLLTTAAEAQARVPRVPQIGLPLPRIGLPHPPTGLPPLGSPWIQQQPGAPVLAGSPRSGRRWQRSAWAPVFLLPPYYWYPPLAVSSSSTTAPPAPVAPRPATGMVWLDVQPPLSMQVFVDGYYVGTTDEVGSGLELEAGPHRLEVRAHGYEPLAFGVRIEANRALTYRDTLRRADQPASGPPPVAASTAPPATTPPMTLYVIPGCYAGNVPPTAATLPAGCEAAGVREIR